MVIAQKRELCHSSKINNCHTVGKLGHSSKWLDGSGRVFPLKRTSKGSGCVIMPSTELMLMGFSQAIIPLKNILCQLHWMSDKAFYAIYLDFHLWTPDSRDDSILWLLWSFFCHLQELSLEALQGSWALDPAWIISPYLSIKIHNPQLHWNIFLA